MPGVTKAVHGHHLALQVHLKIVLCHASDLDSHREVVVRLIHVRGGMPHTRLVGVDALTARVESHVEPAEPRLVQPDIAHQHAVFVPHTRSLLAV